MLSERGSRSICIDLNTFLLHSPVALLLLSRICCNGTVIFYECISYLTPRLSSKSIGQQASGECLPEKRDWIWLDWIADDVGKYQMKLGGAARAMNHSVICFLLVDLHLLFTGVQRYQDLLSICDNHSG